MIERPRRRRVPRFAAGFARAAVLLGLMLPFATI